MMTGEPLPSSYESLEGIDHGKDFSRLQGKIYADYAGAPPYPESVVTLSTQDLLQNVYSNPHSEQGLGEGASLAAVDTLRQKTLQFCNASPAEYECILTSGATGETIFFNNQTKNTLASHQTLLISYSLH